MTIIESILRRCTAITHVKQLQAQMITSGIFQNCPSRTKLVELCAVSPAGNLDYACDLFRQIEEPVTNDWNAIIRDLAQSEQPKQAIGWYLAMIRWPHRPDALTCSFALKSYARVLALIEGKQIHAQLVRFGFEADVRLQTTVLDLYAKCGDLDCVEQVFDEMPLRDVTTWNALVTGLAQGSRPRDALALFSRMRLKGARPNEITVIGALSACSQLGTLKEGEAVRSYMCEEGLDTNLRVCNALIDMYAKCGSIDGALDVFCSMGTRSRVTWNTIIMALAMHGRGPHAVELFTQIRPTGVEPDAVTYLAVLCACNHAGLVDDGLRLFNDMTGSGVAPNIKHYGCIVDLLGRAGRLDEAYSIIISMHLPPDIVLWQSLLGACKTYKNVELAECASQQLSAMGSNSDGDYVLMSNVYAAHERWDDVGRVREAMKSNDVRKVPGFSFIEMNGVIHKFVNGDHGHSDWKEIYGMLDEIGFRIKAFGYLPRTDFVLHDIGEEEKENALFYHSEKLAVAYGLVRTESGAPIQVIKNLRICGDCHDVIKLVSKIYDREIVVRDRSRFHRFTDGSCSCGDYW
ncbi:pentatricopeptide repeat-containing protein At1g34160-like [Magnolia sinica]|uniref:pentatricopeptide repeat-containing protein At1g34160-like n=1 Tax=Magnolia sinica TaxID=86752 RepID=UPI00265B4AB0|nr:pentatricopeptide repeat-containing protein At1g34160-like [Magnolia sinica]